MKYTTELLIGITKVPPKLVELLFLYEQKLWIYEKCGISINSRVGVRKKKVDPDEIPLNELTGS